MGITKLISNFKIKYNKHSESASTKLSRLWGALKTNALRRPDFAQTHGLLFVYGIESLMLFSKAKRDHAYYNEWKDLKFFLFYN